MKIYMVKTKCNFSCVVCQMFLGITTVILMIERRQFLCWHDDSCCSAILFKNKLQVNAVLV